MLRSQWGRAVLGDTRHWIRKWQVRSRKQMTEWTPRACHFWVLTLWGCAEPCHLPNRSQCVDAHGVGPLPVQRNPRWTDVTGFGQVDPKTSQSFVCLWWVVPPTPLRTCIFSPIACSVLHGSYLGSFILWAEIFEGKNLVPHLCKPHGFSERSATWDLSGSQAGVSCL